MEQNLTQAEIVKMAAKAGAQAAIERLEKEREKEKRELTDARLGSIKLLLRNYRNFKLHCANSVYEASQLDEDAIDILNFAYDPRNNADFVIESIKGNALKAEIIMSHIDAMLKIYEKLCRQSKEPESVRHFNVLFDLYISEEQLTPGEIAAKHGIAERTIYRDIDHASEKVSLLIFGLDWLASVKNADIVEPSAK